MHFAQQDTTAYITDLKLGISRLVGVYREVGPQICLPSVAMEFAIFDQVIEKLGIEGILDEDLRESWMELRQLFAES